MIGALITQLAGIYLRRCPRGSLLLGLPLSHWFICHERALNASNTELNITVSLNFQAWQYALRVNSDYLFQEISPALASPTSLQSLANAAPPWPESSGRQYYKPMHIVLHMISNWTLINNVLPMACFSDSPIQRPKICFSEGEFELSIAGPRQDDQCWLVVPIW